jgi:hypothetical protein
MVNVATGLRSGRRYSSSSRTALNGLPVTRHTCGVDHWRARACQGQPGRRHTGLNNNGVCNAGLIQPRPGGTRRTTVLQFTGTGGRHRGPATCAMTKPGQWQKVFGNCGAGIHAAVGAFYFGCRFRTGNSPFPAGNGDKKRAGSEPARFLYAIVVSKQPQITRITQISRADSGAALRRESPLFKRGRHERSECGRLVRTTTGRDQILRMLWEQSNELRFATASFACMATRNMVATPPPRSIWTRSAYPCRSDHWSRSVSEALDQPVIPQTCSPGGSLVSPRILRLIF